MWFHTSTLTTYAVYCMYRIQLPNIKHKFLYTVCSKAITVLGLWVNIKSFWHLKLHFSQLLQNRSNIVHNSSFENPIMYSTALGSIDEADKSQYPGRHQCHIHWNLDESWGPAHAKANNCLSYNHLQSERWKILMCKISQNF